MASPFPDPGETKIITDGSRYFVVASVPKATAENGARAIEAGDVTPTGLSRQIANAVDLAAMPGRIKRARL